MSLTLALSYGGREMIAEGVEFLQVKTLSAKALRNGVSRWVYVQVCGASQTTTLQMANVATW